MMTVPISTPIARPSACVAIIAAALSCIMAHVAQAAAPDRDPVLDAKVESILQQMTLEEKMSLLGGVRRFHVPGIPRLGLPELNLADGPVGVRDRDPSTAYPATVCLAATWDPELAREFGAALGRDARARDYHVLLGPGVNIIRIPTNGRNFEYLAEDPSLAASMAAPIVSGIQSQGVAACPKHFAANNQETNRMTHDVVVSPRALREIYLPAFKASVQDGGAWMVMAAYNRLNGTWCTANAWLNQQLLKDEWGFRGVLVSDWGAAHDTLGIALGGLDLEMPGPRYYWPERLRPLIDSGEIPLTVIDDKIRRMVRLQIALGLPGRSPLTATRAELDAASGEVALQVAREGIVLLKNAGSVLPFDREQTKRIVLLGPNAAHVPFAGGSGNVTPWRAVTVLDALRELAPAGVTIEHIAGPASGTVADLLPATRYDAPLSLAYRRASFAPDVIAETETGGINVDWTTTPPPEGVDPSRFHATWNGQITPQRSGLHLFTVETIGRNATVSLDGTIVVASGDADHLQVAQGGLMLEAGRTYKLVATYTRGAAEGARIRFAWGPGTSGLAPEDEARIRAADAVVACVGFDAPTEGEGADRSYALPTLQTNLLKRAVALNPRVVVVLTAGGSVETADWIDSVPALLHSWYPGQEGGRAIAEILWGDISPSGKLPVTWERRWNDIAARTTYPGTAERVEYAEGVLVGYRWFDAKSIEPLFPFGHGLTYTRFEYRDLAVSPPDTSGAVTVSVTVANTGNCDADDVVQVYVAPPPGETMRPPRELKGFQRVSLAAGEQQRVVIPIATDSLAWFDDESGKWRVTPGVYHVSVGASSRDLRASAELQIP